MFRLQRDDDPDCRAFRQAVVGDAKAVKHSLQGTYVFDPDGHLLGRRNSNDPNAILAMIEAARAKWTAARDGRRPLAIDGAPSLAAPHRWERYYPERGLVLRRTARDLPSNGSPTGPRTQRFNRDALWFSADEARGWLPRPVRTGTRADLPSPLIERLATLVFVDNVRGQTIPYHASEIVDAAVELRIESVSEGRVVVAISGHTHTVSDGSWHYGENYWQPHADQRTAHALTTKLLGSLTIAITPVNEKKARIESEPSLAFESFALVALGESRGRTTFNGRGRSGVADRSAIGFAIELAPATWRVAPTFINVYGADWIGGAPPL